MRIFDLVDQLDMPLGCLRIPGGAQYVPNRKKRFGFFYAVIGQILLNKSVIQTKIRHFLQNAAPDFDETF